MPRQKDSAADQKLKQAQKEAHEITVRADYVPTCKMDNALVKEVWAKLAPPLIEAQIVNFATEDIFTDLCFHIVVCDKMRDAILNGDMAWFEEVQNYGDGGQPILGAKEAGQLKAFRQWNARKQDLMKSLSLLPRDMAGLWHIKNRDDGNDEEDLFT